MRSEFITSITSNIPNITAMHHNDQFKTIMSSSDKFVLRKLAKFIYEYFEIRKRYNEMEI